LANNSLKPGHRTVPRPNDAIHVQKRAKDRPRISWTAEQTACAQRAERVPVPAAIDQTRHPRLPWKGIDSERYYSSAFQDFSNGNYVGKICGPFVPPVLPIPLDRPYRFLVTRPEPTASAGFFRQQDTKTN